MIKILTGWSNKGGSTTAFIALTNALNAAGYETIMYGPHEWHLDKCKSGILDANLKIDRNDKVICHFLQLPKRPFARKVLLSCHEKDLFPVGQMYQYWDEAIFLNQRHVDYHNAYKGKYRIIPNLKEHLEKSDKTGLDKIAGIIGTFDVNKQTHVSIQRALDDGCEKIYLFGESSGEYFSQKVKPLCDANDNVIIHGYMDNKQAMYDMVGRVYHSSLSEVACLVKDECETTGTLFLGTEVTDNPIVTLTNDEIIKKWIKALKP
jgi:hypothetical protein